MQLGFVIDQTRCIGCHACTVACKSENDVPVGSFRTWVKYVEEGEFPAVRRSFAVLRCNQCTQAPCVTICPVSALEKRADGIVDVDPRACIGCKACMQGCPYDALYLNTESGTAQKCHFCAHRTELGLAPACAVVCPTEAIVPGDFDDPGSAVSRLRDAGGLTARKREAGTGPNVLYRSGAPAALDPLRTQAGGGYLWAAQQDGLGRDTEAFRALERRASARTSYDVDHPVHWGAKVSAYLFTKSLAAGAFLAALPAYYLHGAEGRTLQTAGAVAGLVFLLVTTVLLVADLKRPERFLYVLTRPNWSSWLVKGSIALMAFGALLPAWILAALLGGPPDALGRAVLAPLGAAAAGLAACYTAFLFGQAKGRVLWMQRGLWLQLLVQAALAGSALLVLIAPALGLSSEVRGLLTAQLLASVVAQLVFVVVEGRLAPPGREAEYAEAHAVLVRGPLARRHRAGVRVGLLVPFFLCLLASPLPAVAPVAALAALVGLALLEDALVRAGQALSIS